MPQLLTNPAHWRLRAQEARRRAQQLEDPEAKAAKLKMADKYDRLAASCNGVGEQDRGYSAVPKTTQLIADEAIILGVIGS